MSLAFTLSTQGIVFETRHNDETRGKVAGALRPFDQVTCEGSVECWTVEVGKSMFQIKCTRSDPSSGGGEINGFNFTSACITRIKNGSRTSPSNQNQDFDDAIQAKNRLTYSSFPP